MTMTQTWLEFTEVINTWIRISVRDKLHRDGEYQELSFYVRPYYLVDLETALETLLIAVRAEILGEDD